MPATDHPSSAQPDSPRKRQALELFRGLPARYDELSAALSFWQDPRWRRALVDAIAPAAGERLLDVATGTGMVAAELLARAGDCTVVGLDQSAEMLARARARFAAGPDAARVELIEGQAERLPFPDASFDALTFTYLLRYVEDPPRDRARAGARRTPRRARRRAGVRRASARAGARGVALLHAPWACPRSDVCSRASGTKSAAFRPQHRRLLRAPPAAGDRRAGGGTRGCATSACGA